MWLPWQYSVWLAVGPAVATLGFRLRQPSTRWIWVRELTRETAIFATLYTIWQRVGQFSKGDVSQATSRGAAIAHLEHVLHLPSEQWTQGLALHSHLIIKAANWYYIAGHTPVLAIFLVWLYVWHRPEFARWRTALAVSSIAGELIQLVPVAPPRLTLHGIVDTAQMYGPAVYEADGAGFAPQLAAMPSLHFAWAMTAGLAVFLVAGRGWRWLGPAHIVVTLLVVTVTGNHYWLDSIAGGALVVLVLAIYDVARRLRRRWASGEPGGGPPFARGRRREREGGRGGVPADDRIAATAPAGAGREPPAG